MLLWRLGFGEFLPPRRVTYSALVPLSVPMCGSHLKGWGRAAVSFPLAGAGAWNQMPLAPASKTWCLNPSLTTSWLAGLSRSS